MGRLLDALQKVPAGTPRRDEFPRLATTTVLPAAEPPPGSGRRAGSSARAAQVAAPRPGFEAAVRAWLNDTARCDASPGSPLGEQLHSLVENLRARVAPAESPVIAFAAPEGRGVTTTIMQVSAHVVQTSDSDLLVVDGNHSHPELAERLRIAPCDGLLEVLNRKTSWSDVLVQTVVPQLTVLAAGRQSADRLPPAGVEMAELFAELKRHYSMVLCDAGSPTDAFGRALARYADGTCLVVRLGETRRAAIQAALRSLQNAGARLLGCVAIGATGPRAASA